jgi:hypothetical protein
MTDDAQADDGWLADYRGLTVEETLALARDDGRVVRVLRLGDAMTMDYRPQRLNLFLDDAGRLERLTSG